jgi:hypothetical protein
MHCHHEQHSEVETIARHNICSFLLQMQSTKVRRVSLLCFKLSLFLEDECCLSVHVSLFYPSPREAEAFKEGVSIEQRLSASIEVALVKARL